MVEGVHGEAVGVELLRRQAAALPDIPLIGSGRDGWDTIGEVAVERCTTGAALMRPGADRSGRKIVD